jgi:hypothetical protein
MREIPRRRKGSVAARGMALAMPLLAIKLLDAARCCGVEANRPKPQKPFARAKPHTRTPKARRRDRATSQHFSTFGGSHGQLRLSAANSKDTAPPRLTSFRLPDPQPAETKAIAAELRLNWARPARLHHRPRQRQSQSALMKPPRRRAAYPPRWGMEPSSSTRVYLRDSDGIEFASGRTHQRQRHGGCECQGRSWLRAGPLRSRQRTISSKPPISRLGLALE